MFRHHEPGDVRNSRLEDQPQSGRPSPQDAGAAGKQPSCQSAVTQHLQLQLVTDDACAFAAGNEGHVRADGGKNLGRHS